MSTPVDQQHERIRLGLLEYTMQHTVEDEYALVAERTESKTSRRVGLGAGVALLAFGFKMFNEFGGRDLMDCMREAGSDSAAQQQCQQDFTGNLDGVVGSSIAYIDRGPHRKEPGTAGGVLGRNKCQQRRRCEIAKPFTAHRRHGRQGERGPFAHCRR